MNIPFTSSRNSLGATVCALLLIFHGLKASADQGTPDPSLQAKAASFLMQVAKKWSSVQTLQYEVDTRDTESDGFRKSINETGHDRDVLTTHLSFTFKGSDYGWKSDTLVEATGVHERVSTGGRTNGALSILFQGPRSVLMVTNNPKFQSAIPIAGCNPLMEAYSFLVSDDWQGFNCPEVDLNSLLSPETWANAAKRITSYSVETVASQQRIKIIFGPESGNHDVVYFSPEVNGFPLSWQHYEGNYLRREVSLGDAMATRLLPGGGSITLPHLLTRLDYYDPSDVNVFCTSHQTLNLVAVNQPIDEDGFIIDPSLADSIYDRDNNTRISVPK
jgi:hypothetical protein